MFDCIFYQQLHSHRWHLLIAELFVHLDLKPEVILIAHLLEENIGIHKLHFPRQRHFLGVVALQGIAQHPGQLLNILLRLILGFAHQRTQRIQRIEQHMRI